MTTVSLVRASTSPRFHSIVRTPRVALAGGVEGPSGGAGVGFVGQGGIRQPPPPPPLLTWIVMDELAVLPAEFVAIAARVYAPSIVAVVSQALLAYRPVLSVGQHAFPMQKSTLARVVPRRADGSS